MKKLFYVIILCCLAFPYTAHAEEINSISKTDSAFFHAIYQKDISYTADSDSIICEKRQLILIADSILKNKDGIGIILKDTSLFQFGLRHDTFVFCLKNINVAYWDTVDSPMVAIQYIQQKSGDTLLYSVPLSIKENKSYALQPTLIQTLFSPKWMWWTIGGICVIVLLIAGGIVLFLFLKKKNEKDSLIKSDTKNDHPIDDGKSGDDDKSGDDKSGDDDSSDDNIDKGGYNKEIKRLNGIIADLKEKQKTIKEEVEADAQKTLDEAQQKWNQEKEKLQKAEEEKLARKEKEIENIKAESNKELLKKEEKISKLKNEIDELEKKVKSIRDEVSNEKQKEIDALDEKLRSTKKDLTSTSEELRTTKSTLEKTEGQLSNANSQIEYLQESQRQYAEKITFAPYAEAYSNQIKELFDIEHNINEGVIKLSKKGLEDPYHLFKATHRFKTGLAEIDMEKFQVEVEMAAKKQMTFTGNGIAHLATLKGDELEKQVRMYFVLNYLAKYISALQIYNESLIGLEKLMDDVKDADVAQFIQARKQLESLYEAMKIKVICPHLFDSIGNNMDLRVEQVDAGFDSGDILEIMNCLVYAVDGQKPTDKIFVKAQQ